MVLVSNKSMKTLRALLQGKNIAGPVTFTPNGVDFSLLIPYQIEMENDLSKSSYLAIYQYQFDLVAHTNVFDMNFITFYCMEMVDIHVFLFEQIN